MYTTQVLVTKVSTKYLFGSSECVQAKVLVNWNHQQTT